MATMSRRREPRVPMESFNNRLADAFRQIDNISDSSARGSG